MFTKLNICFSPLRRQGRGRVSICQPRKLRSTLTRWPHFWTKHFACQILPSPSRRRRRRMTKIEAKQIGDVTRLGDIVMNRAAVVSLLLIHIATRLIERTSSVNYSAPKYRQPMQRLISSELLICRSEFADISSGLVLCVKWKLQSKADSMSLLALIGMKREFWWRRKTFRIKRESQRIISIKETWMTSSLCDHQLLSHGLLRFQLRHLTLLVCTQPCGPCWELHCFSLRFSFVGAA